MTFDIKPTRDWAADVDKDPSPLWLLEDFLQGGAMCQLTGKAKEAWKTWFMLLMTYSLASGKTIGHFKPTGRYGCLVIEVEGGRKQTRNRFQMLENGCGIQLKDLENHYMMHEQPFQLENRKHLKELITFCLKKDIKFIGIDTFIKCSMADENDSRQVQRALQGLDLLKKETGATVFYVHHIGKPNNNKPHEVRDIDDDTRGSSAFGGHFDQHFAIRKRTPNQNSLDLEIRNKDAEEAFYTACWHIDKTRNATILDMNKLDFKGQVSEQTKDACTIKLLPDELYTQTALKRIWGMPTDKMQEMAELLVNEGILEKRKTKWRLT